jgi:hypothetical protein
MLQANGGAMVTRSPPDQARTWRSNECADAEVRCGVRALVTCRLHDQPWPSGNEGDPT